jgi:cell division septal protein FtsQ
MRGQNIVLADLHEWRDRLLESPWVQDARLRRTLPGTIDIVVAERDPVAIARMGGSLYLIDQRGMVIDEYGPAYQDFDLPIVDGLSERASAPGGTTDEARAGLAARLIAAVAAKPEVGARVSQIDVRDVHNAAIVLSGDPALLYVGEERFLARIESYLQLEATLRERVPEIDYVDLRFDERIYVRPAKSSGVVPVSTVQETPVGVTGRVNGNSRR